MAEATTPEPKKEETTPPGKEAITPKEPKKEEKPATPEQLQKKVVELEGIVETLTKEAEQQKTLQSQADRKRRIERKKRLEVERILKEIRETGVIPEETIPEGTGMEREEKLKIKVGVQDLLLGNPKYQEVLKKDATLKRLLETNPTALIADAIDAEDVIEQIKDLLDDRVSTLEAQPEVEKKKGKEGEGPEFKAPVQPGGEPPEPPKEGEKKEPPKGSEPRLDPVEESIKKRIKFT